MALKLKSAEKRLWWGALAFSMGIEYLIIACLFALFLPGNGYNLLLALLALVALQLALGAYQLLSLVRRTIWYFWHERETRSNAIFEEFVRLNFPRPEGTYIDADAYLEEVALSPATAPEGAMFASMLLGMLHGHRTNGPWSEGLFLSLVVERAMARLLPWSARATL